MTNEPRHIRHTRPNPYASLPPVPTFTLTSDNVKPDGALLRALAVEELPVPNDGTPAYLSFVMLGHTLARATLVATAETRGGCS